MPARIVTCSNLHHPHGELGRITRQTPRVTYRERVCPTCHKIQGIAMVPNYRTA